MRTLLFVIGLVCSSMSGQARLCFIENKGQLTDQYRQPYSSIDFVVRAGNLNMFIEPGVVHYQFVSAGEAAPGNSITHSLIPFEQTGSIPLLSTYRMDMELVGANRQVAPRRGQKLPYYERYYFPQLGEHGVLAYSYSKVTYPDIYPNIDWVVYINGDRVEYDFVVKEGGDPAVIRMKYNGATDLQVTDKGNLVATCPLGSVTEHMPVAFQQDGRKVEATFRADEQVVTFQVAAYSGVLLIDPYIEWATFCGGAGEELGTWLTRDEHENLYIAGSTRSMSNIATTGAYDVTYADSLDAYFAKFDSNGVIKWATYYGGPSLDGASGIAYDSHGSIIIAGGTNNVAGIATVGSDQYIFQGPHVSNANEYGDGYIAKFDTSGSRVWATYFGGTGIDRMMSVCTDYAGNIYVAGSTLSNSIASGGAHQTTLNGGGDGFLAKYNLAGQKLWCTYYGGSSGDIILGVHTMQSGDVLVCGATSSATDIATSGAHQSSYPGNLSGFIAMFDDAGNRDWGTYFGASNSGGGTALYRVTSDINNDIIVTGHSSESSGIATSGSHQSVYGGKNIGQGDALIAKFTNQGVRLWSTYLGGAGDESCVAVASTPQGEIYLAGYTNSATNISVNGFQGNYGGQFPYWDGWFAKFTGSGSCVWSSYLGGNIPDQLSGISLSQSGTLYLAGIGASFPTSNNGHQPNHAGMADGYLARFHDFPTGVVALSTTKGDIVVYPSPNDGDFFVKGVFPLNAAVRVWVTNMLGQEVYSETFQADAPGLPRHISLGSSAAPGVYAVQVLQGNTATCRYIVVER